ncbi:MAG: hypothetical protein R3B06_16260 [Kofleriaceae bacterium]
MNRLSNWMPIVTGALLVALGGVAGLGCANVDCGTGTIERDGTCVPADDNPGNAQCGMGTVLGPTGRCEPEEVVVCDPGTTREEVDPDTGVVTCVGTGGGCAAELACPTPSGGKTSICGRIYDTENGSVIAATSPTGAACDPANPSADGPCSLRVLFFDALDFASNPTPVPLVPGQLTVDDCGRFAAINIPASNLGFTGIAVGDAAGTGDRHKLTGVALTDSDAMPARNVKAFSTRNATDAAWTTSAALAGASFATRGVIAMIFEHNSQPVAGVTARRNGQVVAADDYYFSDATAARTTVDAALTSTGANGTALVINSTSVVNHDGTGAEPGGCQWPSAPAAAIPGVVFVQLKGAQVAGGAPCP